jgi:penicillin amidase
MQTFRRILGGLGLMVLTLALAVGGFGAYTVRRSFPQTSGAVTLTGLDGAVDIYRDQYGIPHIYADTVHDLFMAQGYVHAQDRFYQMDFWRHQTSGRLSELYGEGTVNADKFLRTVGWQRLAEQEYALADAETKAMLDAYAEGVNAYIANRSAADLSLEYSFLAVNGLKYTPEPWSAPSTLAWAKAMAWDLGGNLDGEIQRAILTQKIGAEKTNEYMPFVYPDDHPIILPNPAVSTSALENLQTQVSQLDEVLGGKFDGIGSNNWVIAGSRTTTGLPLLANDPHLSIQMPSIWYEVGLHCRTVTQDCPYDVTGFSFAGAPGVIIGHNNRIAWGFTNVGPDVQDLFIEKINPANPNQYEVNGEWRDMVVVNETIKVQGQIEPDPEEPDKDLGQYDAATNTTTLQVTVRYTRHGPLIGEVYDLEKFATDSGLDPANGAQYAFALRWTALEVTQTWRAIFNLNRAQNFEDFRNALRDFAAPSQNMVYADVDGNIGYQAPGNIPIRKNGDGLLPAPGWTDEYEWERYIPFDDLPYAYNPPQGYIATANNAVVGPDYAYMISLDWDVGYRAERIVEMIEAQPKISIEHIQQMQGDDMNLGAKEVLPYLLAALDKFEFGAPGQARAAEALRGWDYQMRIESQPAAIYMGFFNALLKDTFYDDLPADQELDAYWPGGGSDSWLLLRNILAKPDSAWWDNAATPAAEGRDDILRQAFIEGYASLEEDLGKNTDEWRWGGLHVAMFINATLGRVEPIGQLFNRGPFPTAGGSSIVNATGWNMTRDDRETPDNPYRVGSVPSMRMIVDLSNLDNSLTIHTTGQSGHAYHANYIDMADPWRLIEYHPMLWSAANVQENAEAHLVLQP